MKRIAALLTSEPLGLKPLLRSLKSSQIQVDVLGPIPLMKSFYEDKEAFLNLHIGMPTLEALQRLNPELILFDVDSQYDWLDHLTCAKVGWGRWNKAPGSDGPQLRSWPLPFAVELGGQLFYGPGQTQKMVDYLLRF